MTTKTFKRLIVLSWATGILSAITWFATKEYLPRELEAYLDTEANADLTRGDWFLFAILIGLLLAGVVIAVGLYRFRPWARRLLLPVNAACLILTPFSGPSVMTGVAWMVSCIAAMLSGAVIVAAYLPPASDEFNRPKIAQE